MTDINEVYSSGGDHLKAEDIPPGKQIKLIITGHEVVNFGQNGQEQNKVVLAFNGTDKTLVLNKTNATTIASLHGPNVDNWNGRSIFVYSTKVDYAGKMVDAIRVDLPRETVDTAAQVAPSPSLPPQDDLNDDIPF